MKTVHTILSGLLNPSVCELEEAAYQVGRFEQSAIMDPELERLISETYPDSDLIWSRCYNAHQQGRADQDAQEAA